MWTRQQRQDTPRKVLVAAMALHLQHKHEKYFRIFPECPTQKNVGTKIKLWCLLFFQSCSELATYSTTYHHEKQILFHSNITSKIISQRVICVDLTPGYTRDWITIPFHQWCTWAGLLKGRLACCAPQQNPQRTQIARPCAPRAFNLSSAESRQMTLKMFPQLGTNMFSTKPFAMDQASLEWFMAKALKKQTWIEHNPLAVWAESSLGGIYSIKFGLMQMNILRMSL